MANEVAFVWVTGEAAMTFEVITEVGVSRESGTAMTETPAASGLYLGTPTTILESDKVVVSNAGGVIGGGEWLLDPVNDKIDIIDGVVDDILVQVGKNTYTYDEREDEFTGEDENTVVQGPSHC